MNIVQIAKALDDITIQDISVVVALVNRINEKHLEADDKLDVKASGKEVIKALDKLSVSKEVYSNVVTETLTTEEARSFKKELNLLKEQQTQKETISTNSKNTTIVVVGTLSATVAIGCLIAYMNTNGVNVETSSALLTGFIEVVKVVIGVGE